MNSLRENHKGFIRNEKLILKSQQRFIICSISHQLDINEVYLYAKDPYEEKEQLLISKAIRVCLNNYNESIFFTENLIYMDDIFENIEECNQNKERKIFIAFEDMTTDVQNNKILNPIVTELFTRGKKPKWSLVSLHQLNLMCQKILQ